MQTKCGTLGGVLLSLRDYEIDSCFCLSREFAGFMKNMLRWSEDARLAIGRMEFDTVRPSTVDVLSENLFFI